MCRVMSEERRQVGGTGESNKDMRFSTARVSQGRQLELYNDVSQPG